MSSRQEFKEKEFGIFAQDWKLDILKNRADIIMGQSPPSKFYNNKGIGIPFMQGRKTFGDKYHIIDTWCTQPKRIAKQNSILISVRAPVGDLNIANTELCIGRGLSSINMKNGNNEFLYYLLKNYKTRIISKETGTVFGSINKSGIENLKLPFPSEKEQERIASILSSLDEKIELNNQINKNLEQITQAIFKHWFIDFEFPNENGEPYKSSGGEMVDSEIGPIPKRWKIGKIGDYVKVKSGFAFKNKWWEKYGIPVIKIKNIKNKTIDFSSISCISMDKINGNISKFFVASGDILIAMTGATVGKIALVPKRNGRALVNQRVGKFFLGEKPLEKVGFIYSILSKTEIFNEIVSTAHGSAQPNISPTQIENIKIILPSRKYIEKYNKIVESAFCKITENINQNEYLSNLRDDLLPKLMSGKIRVPINDKEGINNYARNK